MKIRISKYKNLIVLVLFSAIQILFLYAVLSVILPLFFVIITGQSQLNMGQWYEYVDMFSWLFTFLFFIGFLVCDLAYSFLHRNDKKLLTKEIVLTVLPVLWLLFMMFSQLMISENLFFTFFVLGLIIISQLRFFSKRFRVIFLIFTIFIGISSFIMNFPGVYCINKVANIDPVENVVATAEDKRLLGEYGTSINTDGTISIRFRDQYYCFRNFNWLGALREKYIPF